ncbi:MAG: methyltransferase family protein [Flavisolibacter sp.]
MVVQYLLLGILWLLYGSIHSLLAASFVKKKMQTWLENGFRFYRLCYTVFAFVFLAVLIVFEWRISVALLFHSSQVIRVFGIALALAGIFLMILCGRKYFMGVSGLRSLFDEKKDQELLVGGIHQYVRHPLYLGTFAFIWGWFLAFPFISLLISNTIITMYTLVAIRFEERKMIDEFGDAYILYRKKVPALIPSLKLFRRPRKESPPEKGISPI